jgi:hypothetical protein
MSIFVVVEKIDGILLDVSPLIIIPYNHLNVLVARHGLRLAVSEAKTERPGAGRLPQVRRESVWLPLLMSAKRARRLTIWGMRRAESALLNSSVLKFTIGWKR